MAVNACDIRVQGHWYKQFTQYQSRRFHSVPRTFGVRKQDFTRQSMEARSLELALPPRAPTNPSAEPLLAPGWFRKSDACALQSLPSMLG